MVVYSKCGPHGYNHKFGSALRSGRRGRRFESCRPDQLNSSVTDLLLSKPVLLPPFSSYRALVFRARTLCAAIFAITCITKFDTLRPSCLARALKSRFCDGVQRILIYSVLFISHPFGRHFTLQPTVPQKLYSVVVHCATGWGAVPCALSFQPHIKRRHREARKKKPCQGRAFANGGHSQNRAEGGSDWHHVFAICSSGRADTTRAKGGARMIAGTLARAV